MLIATIVRYTYQSHLPMASIHPRYTSMVVLYLLRPSDHVRLEAVPSPLVPKRQTDGVVPTAAEWVQARIRAGFQVST